MPRLLASMVQATLCVAEDMVPWGAQRWALRMGGYPFANFLKNSKVWAVTIPPGIILQRRRRRVTQCPGLIRNFRLSIRHWMISEGSLLLAKSRDGMWSNGR